MNEHEEGFARRLIVPGKRSRYLMLLASQRGRKKVIASLSHFGDFDYRFATEVTSATKSEIRKLLLQKGAPKTCYVMSEDREWDGREISFEDALEELVLTVEGTVISCIPGQLAYLELEGRDGRFILDRSE